MAASEGSADRMGAGACRVCYVVEVRAPGGNTVLRTLRGWSPIPVASGDVIELADTPEWRGKALRVLRTIVRVSESKESECLVHHVDVVTKQVSSAELSTA
jgi:hypothetical protein